VGRLALAALRETQRLRHHERLLLFDPLGVPREIAGPAADREAAVVLTCPWHERDTRNLVDTLGVPVFTPRPDEGTPDVAWLLGGHRSDAHLYTAGERLPVGVEALPGRLPNDLVLWIESHRAVIAGDTLVDFGQGLEIPAEWLPAGVTRAQVAEGLRPLLELPVELVLATHGGPTDKAALERALA
jgi:glyoxylase-like metal-dependent hydrolase (beta-lactamase superfamily II)